MNKKYIYIIFIIILIIIYLLLNFKIKENFINISNDVYVINLDNRPDRLQNIVNYFSDYLTLYRISAIKHDDGAKGCALSHISIIKMAKEKNLPTVLILEDDCMPTESFYLWPQIKQWLDNNKDKWDLYVGGNSYYAWNDNNTIKPLCKLDSIKLYRTKAQSSHFYYWNSTAYDSYLELENELDNGGIADLWANNQNFKIISSVPFIAVQSKDYSNIENRNIDYSNYFNSSEKKIDSILNNTSCN